MKQKTPFILRGIMPSTSDHEKSQSCANIVTHSHAKIVLKGLATSTLELEQHKDKPLVGPFGKDAKLATFSAATSYSILDQLQQTNAQIMIFELLNILLAHR